MRNRSYWGWVIAALLLVGVPAMGVPENHAELKLKHPDAYHSLVTYRDFDVTQFLKGDYSAQTGRRVLERLGKAWLADKQDRQEIEKALAFPDSESPRMIDVIGRISKRLLIRALKKTGTIAFVRRRSYGLRGTNATMFSHRTDRGSAVCIYDPADGSINEIFTTEAGFIADIHPSFDGKKLLMTYKEHYSEAGKSTFHIWEIAVDGSGLRQLTHGPWHDFTPVCYPDGRIVFSSTRVESFSVCQNYLACALYACKEDGSDIRRFDWTTLCTVSPSLMSDGSIIASRWEYQDKTLFTWQGLWTINPNGRELKLYYGNTLTIPEALYGPRQIPETDLVLYTMAGHHHPPVSDIAIADRKQGIENPKATWKITNTTQLEPRSGKTWRETRGGGDIVDFNAYCDPWPFCRELSVVSYGGDRSLPASLVLLDHGGTTYPLFCDVDRYRGCYSPVSLTPRKKPIAIPGDCPQEPGTGTFFVQDVYQGLLAQGVKRGQVKKLRVFRQVPKKYNTEGPRVFDHYPVLGLGSYYVKEYYGTVPVYENGSAYFEVPSNVELYFEAVDAKNKEIQRMGSVTQITAGETVACVGCHEDRLNAPKASRQAMKRLTLPADKIMPPSWGAGPVDYLKQVQPVWDQHCVECHNGKRADGGVDMTADRTRFFNMSFDSLCMSDSANLGYFKDNRFIEYYFLGFGPGGVFPAMKSGSQVSKLTAMLEKGHHDVKLNAEEYERIFVWIDANVPYYSTWDMTRPHTQGGRDLMSLPKGVNDPALAGWQKVVHGFLKEHGQKLTSASINFTRPELSRIIMRNLAQSAGGWAQDEKAIFKETTHPEYAKLLSALRLAAKSVEKYPRIDMPGAKAIPQQRDFGKIY